MRQIHGMAVKDITYKGILEQLQPANVTLVAVSKTKPVADLQELYELGQRDFGENYVQELVEKQAVLPADIRWHFIGHLQSNKVKQIISFVHLVHSIDSLKLLTEVDKQAAKAGRKVDALLQIHIAAEETKFGLDEQELQEVINTLPSLRSINIKGLMGMATFTEDQQQIRSEYQYLRKLFDRLQKTEPACSHFDTLSMGMSGDYALAVEEGSTMVRIGSLIFGERNYTK